MFGGFSSETAGEIVVEDLVEHAEQLTPLAFARLANLPAKFPSRDFFIQFEQGLEVFVVRGFMAEAKVGQFQSFHGGEDVIAQEAFQAFPPLHAPHVNHLLQAVGMGVTARGKEGVGGLKERGKPDG